MYLLGVAGGLTGGLTGEGIAGIKVYGEIAVTLDELLGDCRVSSETQNSNACYQQKNFTKLLLRFSHYCF